MATIYTSGTWKPSAARAEAFVEAWGQFAAWASQIPGASRLSLIRDLHDEGRYVSFGDWSSEDAVRGLKGSPGFKECMAQVLQHVHEFHPLELMPIAVADDGVVSPNGHE